jgi:hypothetical protein
MTPLTHTVLFVCVLGAMVLSLAMNAATLIGWLRHWRKARHWRSAQRSRET